jgi:hypothetical protein
LEGSKSCSVEIARIAKEVERTKIGGRFSFHFTSSKAASQTRFALQQSQIADATVSFHIGSSWWNVQKVSLLG